MRQRRSAERQRSARSASQGTTTRRASDRRARIILYVVIAVSMAAVAGLLAAGWYLNSYRLPRKAVAEAGGAEIQLREVIPYTLLTVSTTGQLDSSTPYQGLNTLLGNRIIERSETEIGAVVGPAEIEAEIARLFEPPPDDENAETPMSLSDEGRDAWRGFLDSFRVTEDEHREWVAGQLRSEAALDYFVGESPESAEQIRLEWIVTGTAEQARDAASRIEEGEEFGEVASALNTDGSLSDAQGVVGWVPAGALPDDVDALIFAEDLPLGELQGPHTTTLGPLVFRVTDGLSEQPLSENMRTLLAQDALQAWLEERQTALDARTDFTPGDAEWVLRQLEDR